MDTEIKRKNPRLRKYGLIAAGAVALSGCIVWAIIASGSSSHHTDASGILIGEVEKGKFDDFIRITGRVETGTIVQVSALETGIVDKKWVEEGAFVNEGDIILTLNNPNLRQQILDSESQLAEKQNMLRDTELAMEKERLQIRQDILTARTTLNQKKRLSEQQSELYKESLTSREEYLKAREEYDLARENLKLLENRQRQDSVYRQVQVAMMRESLHNMQENFMLVRQRADNLNIRASHSGQLGSLDAELGQNIPAGQQVGQINILDNYKLAVNIDEHYIDRVSPGLSAKATKNGSAFELSIKKVYPEVTNGQFKADLAIEGESPSKLRVGQSFPVDLKLGESTVSVMVPKGSFFQTTGGKWIYVIDKDGNTARKREIRIGRQNPKYYEVLEGLDPGERIILSSYASYGDADKIILKNREK
ncbi:MAG: HlyD family efflux transporter periplasmic adaptor subunit [Bacteroidales bacterium]|nr:HlyD family efflux transporter periplasmic adaptor subunit [Bacteroidales bacterium]